MKKIRPKPRPTPPMLSKYLSDVDNPFLCMQKIHKQTACDFSRERKYLVPPFILNYCPLSHETSPKDFPEQNVENDFVSLPEPETKGIVFMARQTTWLNNNESW